MIQENFSGSEGREGIGGVRSERQREGETGKRNVKIMFWNIVVLGSKDMEVWEFSEKFDFIKLTEIYIDEGGWNKMKQMMTKGWKCECQCVKKENRKDRAIGEIITGIK